MICVRMCSCSYHTNSRHRLDSLKHNWSLKCVNLQADHPKVYNNSLKWVLNADQQSIYIFTLLEDYTVFYSLTLKSVFQHRLPRAHSQLMVLLPVSLRRLKKNSTAPIHPLASVPMYSDLLPDTQDKLTAFPPKPISFTYEIVSITVTYFRPITFPCSLLTESKPGSLHTPPPPQLLTPITIQAYCFNP